MIICASLGRPSLSSTDTVSGLGQCRHGTVCRLHPGHSSPSVHPLLPLMLHSTVAQPFKYETQGHTSTFSSFLLLSSNLASLLPLQFIPLLCLRPPFSVKYLLISVSIPFSSSLSLPPFLLTQLIGTLALLAPPLLPKTFSFGDPRLDQVLPLMTSSSICPTFPPSENHSSGGGQPSAAFPSGGLGTLL